MFRSSVPVALALVLAASPPRAQDPTAPGPDLVLIDLDAGLRITESEYRAFLRTAVGGARLDELVWDRLLARAVRSVDLALLAQRGPALAEALRAPELELERRIRTRIATDHGGDGDRWRAHVASLGRTEAEERAILGTELLRELRSTALVVLARDPDELALRRTFEQRFGRDGLRVAAEHRFVPYRVEPEVERGHEGHDHAPEPVDDAARAAARAKADELATRARAGTALEALGGEPLREGWDQLYGADFEDAVRALAVDSIAGPLASRRGWHVVRVRQRTLTRYDDVRDEVERAYFASPPTLGELRRVRERLFAESGATQALAERLRR